MTFSYDLGVIYFVESLILSQS